MDLSKRDVTQIEITLTSSLDRFHKLVIVGALRTDKLMELVIAFVSDHVGYKFVEPVQLDLGRVFSE